HAPSGPALTQRQLAQSFATAAGTTAKVATIPAWVLRAGAVLPGPMRELAETTYQFTAPFVLDSARSQQVLGLTPTPLDTAARETVAWWRAQSAR
ncbi:MAG: epimerase, partial [Actinomycetota bacterium]|nr:epimerase [Actinomycetota bacterium]